jgi:hypothetical protein
MQRPSSSTKTNGSAKAGVSAVSDATAAVAATTKPVAEGRAEGQCGPEEHARRARQTTVSDDQLDRAAAIFRAAGDLSRLKLLYHSKHPAALRREHPTALRRRGVPRPRPRR